MAKEDKEILTCYIAKLDIRSDQLKMLEMLFYLKTPNIGKFCLQSLIKDRVLLPSEKCKNSKILLDSIEYKDANNYLTHILSKYWYKDTSLDDPRLSDPRLSDYEKAEKYRNSLVTLKFISDKFFEILEKKEKTNDDVDTRLFSNSALMRFSPIIINSLIEMNNLILIDAAQAEITLEDLTT